MKVSVISGMDRKFSRFAGLASMRRMTEVDLASGIAQEGCEPDGAIIRD